MLPFLLSTILLQDNMKPHNYFGIAPVMAATALLSSCYFNTAGHIFDAASHNAAVRASDISTGQTIYTKDGKYYTTVPRYRYDTSVKTLLFPGQMPRNMKVLSKEGEQVVQLDDAFAQYLLNGGTYTSPTLTPVDEDILDSCSQSGTVNYTAASANLQEYEYTSGAAPWLYTAGIFDWLCVDFPAATIQNTLAVGTFFPWPIMYMCGTYDESLDMMEACRDGEYDEVKEYMEDGVDPNDFGETRLTGSIRTEIPEDCRGSFGALYVAGKYGNHHISKLLIENGAKLKSSVALCFAAAHGNGPMCDYLISKGSPINSWVSYRFPEYMLSGGYPLHYAALYNRTECARKLVEAGANVNCSYDGYTPLDAALSAGAVECAQYLASVGATATGKFIPRRPPIKGCSNCGGDGEITYSTSYTVETTYGDGHKEYSTYSTPHWETCSKCNGHGQLEWDGTEWKGYTPSVWD